MDCCVPSFTELRDRSLIMGRGGGLQNGRGGHVKTPAKRGAEKFKPC